MLPAERGQIGQQFVRNLAFRCDPVFVEEIAAGLAGVRSTSFADARLTPHRDLTPLFAAADRMRTTELERGEEVALVGAALRLSRPGTERTVSTRDESRVAEALARIEAQGDVRLTLADLAADAQVTRHHFLRIFRRVVGVTPYAYLQTHRLRRAAAALAEGDRTVLDVAQNCGFADLSDFTRLFTGPSAARPEPTAPHEGSVEASAGRAAFPMFDATSHRTGFSPKTVR